MTRTDVRAAGMSRREALRLLGTGTGFGLAAARGSEVSPRAAEWQGTGQGRSTITFPDGAIVRTVLADERSP